MDLICWPLIIGAFIIGALITKLFCHGRKEQQHIEVQDVKQSELLILPDEKLPCWSYFKAKTSDRPVRCNDRRCDHFHLADLPKSSLMKLVESLADARQIDLCIFKFTLTKVADLFIHMKSRGVRIRIIADNPRKTAENNQIPKLKAHGIEVREEKLVEGVEDKDRALMHNKFVIIDKKCCLLGSFNWTLKAVTSNDETLLKNYEPIIVKQLSRKFESMWRKLGSPPSKITNP